MIPAYIGSALYLLIETGEMNDFFTTFGIAYGAIMALVLLSKFKKFVANYKRMPYLVNNCRQISDKISEERALIDGAASLKAIAEKLISEFNEHPDMSEEQIAVKREEFDAIVFKNRNKE